MEKVIVLFDGGMGEFPISGWTIKESKGSTRLYIEPNTVNDDGCIIFLPGITLDNKGIKYANIKIRGQYPSIVVVIDTCEEYTYATYTYCGYMAELYNMNGKNWGAPFAYLYKCELQKEERYESLPF